MSMFGQVVPDPLLLNTIIQGGSFGLVVAIFGWSAYILVPRVLKAFEDRDNKFEQMVSKIQDRNDKELERRAKADDSMVTAMTALVSRMEILESYGCAYRSTHSLPVVSQDDTNGNSGRFRQNPKK